jgi:hypothetical protein
MRWILGFAVLLVLSLAVLATPTQFEGPILLLITPNHGLTLTDVLGMAVIVPGWAAWLTGVWHRRRRMEAVISAAPALAVVGAFLGGLGAGLVIATTRISWLWLPLGTILFATVGIGAAPLIARGDQPSGQDRPPPPFRG